MLLDLAAIRVGVQSRLEEAIAYFGTARRLYEAGELEWKLAGCLRLGSWKSCVPKG